MTHQQRMEVFRNTLSELDQAHITTAFCLGRLQELVSMDDPAPIEGRSLPCMDESSYCVVWKRQRCRLGHTTSFKLLARLLRRPNQYVSYDHLLRDVWQDRVVSRQTIRSAIRLLKMKLARANMRSLAQAIEGHGQHYGFMLTH
jgi:hypothetical protein